MKAEDNPYNPGAGARPPELAGRDDIVARAEITIKRNRSNGDRAFANLVVLNLMDVWWRDRRMPWDLR